MPTTGDENALVGQQLGEYRVKRCIGRGGMGVVYEAEHVSLNRKVAIKLLREEHARSPYARNLLSEARAASAIQHRGIIDVFGFGQQPGIGQYLVMEYLEGQPLSEFMAEHAPLPPAEAIQLLGEVLDALSAAHAQGVIHRDLKPSNIFIVREQDGSRYIKLLDFGLAKRTTPDGLASRSEIIVGTPNYMAPEQALNEAVGPRTDLYAVGVIAFEMLTRRRLFAGRSNLEMVAHHLKSPPPRPSFYVELPARLDALILRLLAKEPQARPATASEVATELRALLPTDESTGKPAALSPLFQAKYSPAFAFMEEPTQQQTPREPASSRPPSPFTPYGQPFPAVPLAPPEVSRARWHRGAATSAVLVLLAGGGGLMGGLRWEPERSLGPAIASAQPSMASPPPASPSSAAQTEALTEALPRPSPSEPALAEESPAATGILHISIKGAWADVWVDGKMLGRVPPLHRYTLSAGEHELELRSPGLPTHPDRIVIPPGGILPYTRQLQPPPPSRMTPTTGSR
ncbi:serine/threonine-protein kinase [Hyalangium minutum]|uniref:serine/threonine-protein kinase n=1 Tax=Hyalangium minutum TaxID=394096 RepID=UPI000A847A6D|nr:serine/threonine-protein kinase [Hyalangium minutum]